MNLWRLLRGNFFFHFFERLIKGPDGAFAGLYFCAIS